jgi:DNA-binding NarL/FixJ family response regulator
MELHGGPAIEMRRHLVGLAAGLAGDLTEMRRVLAPVWASEDPSPLSDLLWTTVRDVVRVEVDAAVASGSTPEASDHLATIDAVAAKLHRYGDLGEAWPLELEAQLARFRGEDARDLFRNAHAAWSRVGHVYDMAVCDLLLAEQSMAAGDRDAARRHALAAQKVATSLRAGPLALRVSTLIGRLGGRSTQVASLLTAREHEVLELLALGRTNHDIATTLFMSPKTASVHVSRIMTKLGARNRTEAAAIARRDGLLT